MSGAPYAIIGLGRPRSPWFRNITSWANSGALGASFAKAYSCTEVRQQLASSRFWSVLLIDASFSAVAQDVLSDADEMGVPVVFVGSPLAGSSTEITQQHHPVLATDFSRHALAETLSQHARVVGLPDAREITQAITSATTWKGSLIGVTGPGGTGASTVAMALSQHLGAEAIDPGSVVLVDATRNAEQSVLHNIAQVTTSIEDLIEANRLRLDEPDNTKALASDLDNRGYSLIAGVRKASAWTTFGRSSIDRSLEALRSAFIHSVVDITADFETRASCGSADIEDRNGLSLATARACDLLVIVGAPGVKGTYSTWQILRDLLDIGVDAQRVMVLFNACPRSPLARRNMASALGSFLPASTDLGGVHFTGQHNLEPALVDATPLPAKFVKQAGEPVRKQLEVLGKSQVDDRPVLIEPGSMGIFDEGVSA